MIRGLSVFILCMCCICPLALSQAAQSEGGRFYPQAGTVVPAIYGGNSCGNNGSTSPITCTWGVSVPSGATIVGDVLCFGTAGTISVADSNSDSYTKEPIYQNGTSFASMVFYTLNISAAVTTITYTWTGCSNIYPIVAQVFGIAAADGYNKAQGTTGTTYTSGNVTVTGGNDILIGFLTTGGASGVAASTDGQGNTYTLQTNNSGADYIETIQETSANTYHASATASGNNRYNMEVLALTSSSLLMGNLANWGSNGRDYADFGGTGKFYSGQFSATGVFDAHGGTNAGTPTQTTVFNSIYGTIVSSSSNVNLGSLGSNLLYTNADQPVILTTPAIISSAGYGGDSGLGIGGVTTASSTAIGSIALDTASVNSASLGFSLIIGCPANISAIDCGAEGGLEGSSDYAVIHVAQGQLPGDVTSYAGLTVFFEDKGNSGVNVYHPILPSTIYRVNIQMNNSGTNQMKLCDKYNRPLYYWTGVSFGSQPNVIIMGFSGEEPATAGWNYYWWNYVYNSSGTFSATGACF
jgi:hypothetical protein